MDHTRVYLCLHGSRKGLLICAATKKISFETLQQAEKRLEEIRDKSNVKRAYCCDFCKHWHLTSELSRQNRRKRNKKRELSNDGLISCKRVSVHNDNTEFRKKIEKLYATELGLVNGDNA